MRKKGPPRVLGPYAERDRFRLIVIEGGGRKSMYLSSEEEAQRVKSEISAQLKQCSLQRRIGDLLNEWTAERLASGGCKEETAREQEVRLRAFLADHLERDITSLSPQAAAALYQRAVEQPSQKTGGRLRAATHRFYLKLGQSFFSWAATRGHVARSPFADVKPVGKVQSGKPQLRLDEARSFIDAGMRLYAEGGQPLALGAVMALMMGLRTGEVIARQVRDVEDGGRFLCIAHGKTLNAARRTEVPAALRAPLLQLVQGKEPTEPLFGLGSTGKPLKRQALHSMVRRLCERAGVPMVCTHSLRGLFATLGVQSGAVTHAVAATLGHGSFAVTQKHYAQPDAIAIAQTRRVTALLAGEPAPTVEAAAPPAAPVLPLGQLSAEQLLSVLDDATRARLAALLIGQAATSAPAETPSLPGKLLRTSN